MAIHTYNIGCYVHFQTSYIATALSAIKRYFKHWIIILFISFVQISETSYSYIVHTSMLTWLSMA